MYFRPLSLLTLVGGPNRLSLCQQSLFSRVLELLVDELVGDASQPHSPLLESSDFGIRLSLCHAAPALSAQTMSYTRSYHYSIVSVSY